MNIDFLDTIKHSIEKRVSLIPDLEVNIINTLDFCDIFKDTLPPVIISEIKFASPSRGLIYNGSLSHVEITSEYLDAGSAAISVLVEPEYFQGNINYIKDIRKQYTKSHILMKDFVLNKKQIDQGILYGANAILLIVAFLEENTLKELYDYSLHLGLTSIIEVHNIQELEKALRLRPSVIGVNNRNLQSLDINLNTSRELIKHIPDNCYKICESGIDNPLQIQEMLSLGFNGFLIGSFLMNNSNPGFKLKKLINEVQYES